MKWIINSSILLMCLACRGQVQNNLEGTWLPEKYVLSILNNDSILPDTFLFPVEGFEISNEKTRSFLNSYSDNTELNDTVNLILIKTFNSELNTILVEEVFEKGRRKYLLPYFYNYLNMIYIDDDVINNFKNAKVFIYKSNDKLILEINFHNEVRKINFINHVGGYKFGKISNSMDYLKDKY